MPYDVTMPDGTIIHDVPDGTTKAQLQAKLAKHNAPKDSTLADMGKSFVTGLAQSVTHLPDVADLFTGKTFADQAYNEANAQSGNKAPPLPPSISTVLDRAVGAPFGGLHEPQTIPGEYARTIGQFAPAAAFGPGGAIARTASAVVPAVTSETAGQFTKGSRYEGAARLIGAVGGGAATGLRFTPPSILGDVTPETIALANKARDLGVNIRPGQAAERPFTKVADSELQRLWGTGYGGKIPTNQQQNQQFTRAVSRTFGEDSPVLTQDVMANARRRIGKVYETVLPRNSINTDRGGLLDNLDQIAATATDNILPGPELNQIVDTVQKIRAKAQENGGVINGRQYQTWRQRGGLLNRLSRNSDPSVSHYGGQMLNALDNEFAMQASPADAQALQTARAQYRAYQTVKPLAAKAPTGEISPALLAARVNAEFPDAAEGGAGALGDLGRIGQKFLKEPPNSGTAERSLVLKFMSNPLSATGHAIAAPISATVGRAMNAAINSRPMIVPEVPVQPIISYRNPYPGLFGSHSPSFAR